MANMDIPGEDLERRLASHQLASAPPTCRVEFLPPTMRTPLQAANRWLSSAAAIPRWTAPAQPFVWAEEATIVYRRTGAESLRQCT